MFVLKVGRDPKSATQSGTNITLKSDIALASRDLQQTNRLIPAIRLPSFVCRRFSLLGKRMKAINRCSTRRAIESVWDDRPRSSAFALYVARS